MSRHHADAPQIATAFGGVGKGLVRIQPFIHYPRVLGELGADPQQVFAEAEIPAALFDHPGNTISFAALGRLMECSVAATDCPHFGLLLGCGAAENSFGLLSEVLQQCADVGTAIAHFQQYFHLHDRGGMATRSIDGRNASIGYILLDGDGPSVAQIMEGAMAIGMGLMRTLCGPNWKPAAVLLPHRRPRNAKPYLQVFGVMPEFNAERAALQFPALDFTRRIAGADQERYALLSERLNTVAARHHLDFSEQVRRVVRALVVVRRCSLDEVAALFSMNRRRMNRMLEREGTSYQQIAQEIRCRFAERLMCDTDMSLGEISAILDYADASVFTRAFCGWHGCTPSEWRRRNAVNAGQESTAGSPRRRPVQAA
jgi:AraC-like DNA-binding protein